MNYIGSYLELIKMPQLRFGKPNVSIGNKYLIINIIGEIFNISDDSGEIFPIAMNKFNLNDIITNSIIQLKEHELSWTMDEKKYFLIETKLTINDLHKLYCEWFNVDKSALSGNKNNMINSLSYSLDTLRRHNILINI